MLLPVLEALLQRARTAAVKAAGLEQEMRQLSQRIFLAGGMHIDVVAAARRRAEQEKATQETKDTLTEIDAIGVRVQDLEEGLLDFPCLLDGNVVMLCWKIGEPTITHWHAADESAEARQPLDWRFGKTEHLN